MPLLSPLPDWTAEDVFIIGGGHSLKGFDWNLLRGRCTIGCNQAFKLGAAICNIATFGDYDFWTHYKDELETYKGWVATNYLTMNTPPWLRFYPRIDRGLGNGVEGLAWNNNTGALAVNLALVLGARQVFLLGFDMRMESKEKSHWHDERINDPSEESYLRFIAGFENLKRDLPVVFPGREVYNITDGTSLLKVFPEKSFPEVFGLELTCAAA